MSKVDMWLETIKLMKQDALNKPKAGQAAIDQAIAMLAAHDALLAAILEEKKVA